MGWHDCDHMDKCPVCQEVRAELRFTERVMSLLVGGWMVVAVVVIGASWGWLPPLIIQPK